MTNDNILTLTPVVTKDLLPTQAYPDYKKEQENLYRNLFAAAKKDISFEDWYRSATDFVTPVNTHFILKVNKCQWDVMKDSWISYDDKGNVFQSWTGLPNSWAKIKKTF